MLASALPVICGRSGDRTLVIATAARERTKGRRSPHPMPYGNLLNGSVQRFATRADLDAARCTVEEREEYEPHIASGNLVFVGVDYAAILAEKEADIIVGDGRNNDFPMIR